MLIGALQSKMDVKLMNELARTLEITVKDYNPEKAADILNNISEEFIDFEKENKRASSQSVINFINEQLMQISDTLKTSENGIQSYTKNNNIIRNDEIFKSKLSKITSVEEQLLSIDLEHRILDTLKKDLEKIKQLIAINYYLLYRVLNLKPALKNLRCRFKNYFLKKKVYFQL